jgi:hypothetical protein
MQCTVCLLLQAPWPQQLAELSNTSTIAAVIPQPTSEAVLASIAPSASGDRNSINSVNSTSADSSITGGSGSDFYHPSNVFKGVRARVGIWSGPMDRVLPHGKSGRADYLGPPANRAARMMGAAQGGQVSIWGVCPCCLALMLLHRKHSYTHGIAQQAAELSAG